MNKKTTLSLIVAGLFSVLPAKNQNMLYSKEKPKIVAKKEESKKGNLEKKIEVPKSFNKESTKENVIEAYSDYLKKWEELQPYLMYDLNKVKNWGVKDKKKRNLLIKKDMNKLNYIFNKFHNMYEKCDENISLIDVINHYKNKKDTPYMIKTIRDEFLRTIKFKETMNSQYGKIYREKYSERDLLQKIKILIAKKRDKQITVKDKSGNEYKTDIEFKEYKDIILDNGAFFYLKSNTTKKVKSLLHQELFGKDDWDFYYPNHTDFLRMHMPLVAYNKQKKEYGLIAEKCATGDLYKNKYCTPRTLIALGAKKNMKNIKGTIVPHDYDLGIKK